MKPQVVLNIHAAIGESALWDPEGRLLYWSDIKAPALYRHDPRTGENRCWQVTSDIGAFALMDDDGALVALRHGLFRLDLNSGALDLLAPPPFDPALFRFNEGACDAGGRFWVGVMFDPVAGDPEPQAGQLHSFTLSDGLRPEDDWAELHNGFAFSADGHRFFISHSNENRTYLYDISTNTSEGARLHDRRLFATVPDGIGIPDGAALDTDGGYWCCLHGGGRVRRYHPDGQVDRDIFLPVSKPTMCAFAGSDMEDLYITTASDKLTPQQHRDQPLAGALFRCRPGARGIAKPWRVQ